MAKKVVAVLLIIGWAAFVLLLAEVGAGLVTQ